MTVRIQSEDFNLGQELTSLTRGRNEIGAIASFIGLCRDFNQDRAVSSLYLEHYPGMAERQLAVLEDEARRRWPLEACLIIHRYGSLEPGAQIVLVATASTHRTAAFESCQFLTDWLKISAPFWKAESTLQGTIWLEGRAEDQSRAKCWSIKDVIRLG